MPRRWACGDCRRRHTWVPPYRGISKGAVKRGVGDAAPYGSMVRNAAQAGGVESRPYAGQDNFRKNVIPRSEATWESVFPVWQRCGVRVLRFATPACAPVRNDRFFGNAVHIGGGVRAPRPTGAGHGGVRTGRCGHRPLRMGMGCELAAGFIGIVDDEFLPRSGRFGHPANFYNFFIMGT